MKRLSKDDIAKRDELIALLRDETEVVTEAFDALNAAIEAANAAIDSYNRVLFTVDELRDKVVGEMEVYCDERSEKWQESEAGQAYDEWRQAWQDLDVDAIDRLDAVDAPDMPHADAVEELDYEPNR